MKLHHCKSTIWWRHRSWRQHGCDLYSRARTARRYRCGLQVGNSLARLGGQTRSRWHADIRAERAVETRATMTVYRCMQTHALKATSNGALPGHLMHERSRKINTSCLKAVQSLRGQYNAEFMCAYFNVPNIHAAFVIFIWFGELGNQLI